MDYVILLLGVVFAWLFAGSLLLVSIEFVMSRLEHRPFGQSELEGEDYAFLMLIIIFWPLALVIALGAILFHGLRSYVNWLVKPQSSRRIMRLRAKRGLRRIERELEND